VSFGLNEASGAEARPFLNVERNASKSETFLFREIKPAISQNNGKVANGKTIWRQFFTSRP
jgi:hypothetical protein